jgi:hypothetical protein
MDDTTELGASLGVKATLFVTLILWNATRSNQGKVILVELVFLEI